MIKILFGIVFLGLVVFIHELGHFIAARISGVAVETFSLGWGPVLLRKKWGSTEYRLSLLPLGGYCGMKGEHAFADALEKKLDYIPREEGGFYAAHPLKRIFIAFMGPFFNLVFAVLALALSSAIGYTYQTTENAVIPIESFDSGSSKTPSAMAGLLEGDRIVSMDGTPTPTFADIRQYVATRPGESIELVIDRAGKSLNASITPELDKKTGAGRIGIYPYVPTIIGKVAPGSAAESAKLMVGDVITSVDSKPIVTSYQFATALDSKPQQIAIGYRRDGIDRVATLVLVYTKEGAECGINWKAIPVTVKGTGLLKSLANGVMGTGRTIALTVKSIGLLFRGVDVTEAVSGPVRITMMIGEVAETGPSGLAELLSIICVSLFLMNLLPIPILDGGLILFTLVELVMRKPLKPKTMYYVQFIGIAFILGMFFLALLGDIKYIFK
ncbi:MAG TPA: RIP metalloprotease RseP [Treponemataceae bacterium]|nr:RIP metalloprotease RseP [Treponemataceae bacterium]